MIASRRRTHRAQHHHHHAPPLVLPSFLTDVSAGLIVVRPGPLGPDIADLNRTAAAFLGGETTRFLGMLLADCRCLHEVSGLSEAVAAVARGSATGWRATHTFGNGQETHLSVSRGPGPGSALLQLFWR